MRRPGSSSGAFILEVLVMTAFFALSAAICMRVFVGAQVMARDSGILSEAALFCQSAAECWRASEGDMEATAELLDGELTDGRVSLQREGWSLLISETERGTAEIEAVSGGRTVFELQVKAVSR